MRIDAGPSYLYPSQRALASAVLTTATADTTTAGTSGAKQIDFTNMTRQDMRNWVNDQIRSGKMSLDDSTPFVGMTLKVSTQGFQLVDGGTDTTRVNFMENARLGIEGALSRNDQEGAKQLQVALDLMLKFQGQTSSVDTRA